jgi:hypothetical protein
MNKKSILFILLAFLFSGYAVSIFADDDEEHEGREEHRSSQRGQYRSGVAVVDNKVYLEECGSCHFAYQPGLLPERSWKKLMGGLDDHFGENAELPADTQTTLTNYLVENAADFSDRKFSMKFMRSLSPDQTPLRISEIRYMAREHNEIPDKMVTGNPDVKSLSFCDKCHTRASEGDYSERAIKIPNYEGYRD